MIIVGYPGIGKSTIANKNALCIDLESSMFNDEFGNKIKDWYKYYCNVAIDLHNQGKTVFVSNHSDVYNQLSKYELAKTDLAFILACRKHPDLCYTFTKACVDYEEK